MEITNIIFFILFLSISISIYMGNYIYKNLKHIQIPEISIAIIGQFLWAVFYYFELRSNTISVGLFFGAMKYLAISIIIVGIFLYIVKYTDSIDWTHKHLLKFLIIWPIINIGFVLWLKINPTLVFREYSVLKINGYSFFAVHPGLLLNITYFINYIFIISGILILLPKIFKARDEERKGVVLVLLMVLVPFVGSFFIVFETLKVSPFLIYIDLMAHLLLLSNIFFVFGVKKYEILNILPSDRDKIMDLVDYGIISVSVRGRILDLNKTAISIFNEIGGDDCNVIGRDIEKTISTYFPSGNIENITDKSAIYKIEGKSGREMIIEIGNTTRESEKTKSKDHLISINNVTEKYTLTTELKKYKSAFEASNFVVLITDVNGLIEKVNPAFTKVTGYEFEEVKGKSGKIFKSGHHDDAFYKNLWDTINSGLTWKGEFLNKKKDGTLYWERASISPIFNEMDKIINFVAIREDITKERELAKKFEEMSYTDFLTGVYNRRKAMEEGTKIFIEKRNENPELLYAMMIDIDHFKSINDTHGHGAGDDVLRNFSKILKRSVRSNDVVGRIGGEEFLLILENTSLEGACKVAERIRAEVQSQEVVSDGKKIKYTVSIGISGLNNENTLEELVKKADKALYTAKTSGRNNIKINI